MPLDNAGSFAVLKWIVTETYRAFQQSRARDCGNIMFGIKDKLNEIGLTLEEVFILYNQYQPSVSPRNPEPEVEESQPKHEEQPKTAETKSSRTYYRNMNEPIPDPNTWWVVDWANHLERHIPKNITLLPKDIGHLSRMQTARTSCVRNNRELVWLRDIAHRIGQPIIQEYWDWWDTLTPEQQDEANNRQ